MQIVARYLKDHALTIPGTLDADLFGRSAFNRYYYATYLAVKRKLKPRLPALPREHAVIPDYLRGLATGQIAQVKRAARRVGDHQLMQRCTYAKLAANELAELLVTGYGIRVIADYDPEVPVDFLGTGCFALNHVSVAEAEAWPRKADAYISSILAALP